MLKLAVKTKRNKFIIHQWEVRQATKAEIKARLTAEPDSIAMQTENRTDWISFVPTDEEAAVQGKRWFGLLKGTVLK